MLSKLQDRLYWRMWGSAKKARPDLDRHALHREPSPVLPASHTDWENEHLDEWIARCKAIANPENMRAQVRQVQMPATRHRVFIGHCLTALGRDERYAEGIVATMKRNAKALSGYHSAPSMDTLDEPSMKAVMIAIKKECRRTWPKKEDLLGTICDVLTANQFPAADARCAVLGALNRCEPTSLHPDDLPYEQLLVMLSALRTLAAARTCNPAAGDLHASII